MFAMNNQAYRFVHLQSKHGAVLPTWFRVPQASEAPLAQLHLLSRNTRLQPGAPEIFQNARRKLHLCFLQKHNNLHQTLFDNRL